MRLGFKTQTKKDTEMLIVAMDALLALLHKKGVVTTREMQDEVLSRAENDVIMVGDIEYKVDKEDA